jgi:protein ImuA
MIPRPQTGIGSPPPSLATGGGMGALRQAIRALEAGLPGAAGGLVPLGVPVIDAALGGGLARGALHEIAAAREAEIAAATGFALAVAMLTQVACNPGRLTVRDAGLRPAPHHEAEQMPASKSPLVLRSRPKVGVSKDEGAGAIRCALWIAEDMALAESGAPYGPGLDESGIAPERLVTVAAARAREVLWAMEEALRCRAVGAVIGEMRSARIDRVATRRLSLAAADSGALALLLRAAPDEEPSAAATRWIVGAARSRATTHGVGPPRLALRLARNRRGHLGAWIVEINRVEQRLILAPADLEPVADAAFDRPDRKAEAA